jgi:hypothetical protein
MHLLNFNSFLITKYIEAFSVLFLSNDIRHFFIKVYDNQFLTQGATISSTRINSP